MNSGTETSVELRFCDLCGVSIPQRDLEAGLAREAGDKTVGACCLAKLLEDFGRTPKPTGGGARAGATGPILYATVVLLAAVLGATFYLDQAARDRDPSAALAGLGGRVDGLEDLVNRQERTLQAQSETLVREVGARLAPGFDRVQADIAALEAKLPKPDRSAEELKERLTNLAEQIKDLAARQGAIEGRLGTELGALREELSKLDRTLVDLRRSPLATGPASPDAPKQPEVSVEPLPDTLGRKLDELRAEDPGRRWSAVDELVRSGDKRVIPYILPMLKDSDPFVRRLTAEGLAQIGSEDLAGALIDALDDKEPIVREAAHQTLIKLTSKRFPFDPEASDSARKSMVKRWRSWWDERGKK